MKTPILIAHEFFAGRNNGRVHHALSPHWRAENEHKAREGSTDDRPAVASYWQGYTEGMAFPEKTAPHTL